MSPTTVRLQQMGKLDGSVQPTDLTRLARALRRSCYTTSSLRELLSINESDETVISNVGRYAFFFMDELSRTNSATAVLAQLFLFAGPVSKQRYEVITPELRDLLEQYGLVEISADESTAHPHVALTEYRSRYFISDMLFKNYGGGLFVPVEVADGGAPVMPIHASSLLLHQNLNRPAAAHSLLDVGCGSGCQSILVGSEYRRVLGCDLNPRAVAYSRLNATLNGVDVEYTRTDCRSYDDGTQYDHIIWNSDEPSVVLEFMSKCVDRLMSASGCCQVWMVLRVSKRAETAANEILESGAVPPNGFSLDLQTHRRSGFSLSQLQISRGLIPAGCLLVRHPSQNSALLTSLRENGIIEVVPSLLTMRRKVGPTRVVEREMSG